MTIDWQMIRLRYESGEAATAIAKSLGGRPTRQGIMKRVKSENWVKGSGNAITVASELPIVQRAIASKAPTKATAECVGFVLDLVSRGASETLAARAAGIHPETLKRWKTEDQQLAEQLRQARAGKLAEWISRIDAAASRDWKAADRLLQVSPDAEDFNQQQSGGITVVLNIDRDAPTTPKPIVSEQ